MRKRFAALVALRAAQKPKALPTVPQNRRSPFTITPHAGQRGGSTRSNIWPKGAKRPCICTPASLRLFAATAMAYAKSMRPPQPAAPSAPFSSQRRRRRHARAQSSFASADFLHKAMVEETTARIHALGRPFPRVLDLGGPAPAWKGATRLSLSTEATPTIIAEEDQLPFAPASFDLIISIAGLASLSDLPGALLQARRALAPDGLFAACIPGGLTLGELREDLILAESHLLGRAAARIAPMVEAQAAAHLLARAGFIMPVADTERLTVRYPSLDRLFEDLTAMGARSPLAQISPLRRDVLADARRRFTDRAAADGKTSITIDLIHMAGWAPGTAPSLDSPLSKAITKAI
jgi:SAM-dependent methyltransferase